MPAETYIAKTIETAPDAIASHVRWKIALLLAVHLCEPLSERATLAIQFPEQCSIGKWLNSDHTKHLRDQPEYMAALNQHNAFHGQMQGIAKLINSGEYEQASELLNAAEPFQSASTALANAFMALERTSVGKPVSQALPVAAASKTA